MVLGTGDGLGVELIGTAPTLRRSREADTSNHAIRRINPSGVVATLAGNGISGFVDATGSRPGWARLIYNPPSFSMRIAFESDPELQALMDACFADHVHRGDGAPSPPADRLGLQVFAFQIRP